MSRNLTTNKLTDQLARLNDVLCAVNTLNWDARTQMPAGGATTRGQQIATLMGLARSMIIDPAMQAAVDEAGDDPSASVAQEAIDYHRRLPAELLKAQSESATVAGAAWAKARASSDFSLFQPHLEKVVDLARQSADALGYEKHPYDPMVRIYEPGETAASLSCFFDELRSGILPILDTARGRPVPRTDFLYRHYPQAGQQAFATGTAQSLGFDFERGRLDTTVHPFEVSFTRNDVRITSRWPEQYLPMSIFGSIHEVGHALYEQGIAPELTRSAFATDMIGLYAVGGTSFGMHESQSRLYENHVGRSAPFWEKHYVRLRDTFPDQLRDVSVDEFLAAVNRVEPGAIRVEADELSYDLHIMLRVKIEMGLMDGSLSVADIPDVWREAMHNDLGVAIDDDANGCLQDVHWSSGYLGSFPTYTIGNATAAQLMAHLDEQSPQIRHALNSADTAPLNEALTEKVWQWGRRKTRAQILEASGLKANDASPYLAYLKGKFS
ncbi:carboxypeptidase M32 [Granulosicoccus antarcticus]|uniref:Metal-dependent carboxypeptidase n=1 Tax=Granulosicoccus antarcticus IMCC3135 TaxID=1192854 RepID=A0A2Z2NYA5_9GAMM|nr:carboxypeptidase M32 [Granulosicoccus antarcticus]ASJ72747.1 Carboxypeptidase 1 [Granulosicoccus antarcticus IMCC3135]